MSKEIPEFDPSPPTDEGPEADPKQVSRIALAVGLLIMLIPAAVPLYFALGAEGTTAILLFALAGAVALVNTLLVFGLWNWLNSLQSESN